MSIFAHDSCVVCVNKPAVKAFLRAIEAVNRAYDKPGSNVSDFDLAQAELAIAAEVAPRFDLTDEELLDMTTEYAMHQHSRALIGQVDATLKNFKRGLALTKETLA